MHRLASLLLSLFLALGAAHAFITTEGDRTRWLRAPSPGLARCSGDLPAAPCRAAVAAAFATWGAVEGVDLPMPALIDGVAELTVDFVSGRPDLVGVLGVTTTTTEGGAIVRALVEFNDDFVWANGGPRGTFDVQATATHEIGHALGLAHSPDRGATMYWHYDPDGASLADDDVRGIRFLYGGSDGGGQPCDTCRLPSDCASGICLQRLAEPGKAYCAQPCGEGCPAGEQCVGLLSGGGACIPSSGSCGFESGLPAGAYCWAPFHCARGLRCVVFPGDARCAVECGGPGDCAPGLVCTLDPVDLPRACLAPGGAPLGAACEWATACADGVCLPDGRCSRWCGDCPVGWRCEAHPYWPDRPSVCVPEAPDAGTPDAGPADGAVDDAASVNSAAGDGGIDASLDETRTSDRGADREPGEPRADAPPPVVPITPPADAPDGCQQGSDQPRGVLVLLAVMLLCAFGLRRKRR